MISDQYSIVLFLVLLGSFDDFFDRQSCESLLGNIVMLSGDDFLEAFNHLPASRIAAAVRQNAPPRGTARRISGSCARETTSLVVVRQFVEAENRDDILKDPCSAENQSPAAPFVVIFADAARIENAR
jgi:hypothetical protein